MRHCNKKFIPSIQFKVIVYTKVKRVSRQNRNTWAQLRGIKLENSNETFKLVTENNFIVGESGTSVHQEMK